MNDGNESAWSVFWWIAVYATLVAALPLAIQENGIAGGCAAGTALAFELFMLALPSLLRGWERDRPRRERAHAEARERAAAREQERAGREEARRRKRADGQARREARAAEAQSRRDALAARQEAEAYYRAHAELLAYALPPSLFRAEVASAFPAGIGPAEAWQAARDLIARMQPLVRQEQERQRQEDERQARRAEQARDIDNQIRSHEARIATLRRSGLDPDLIEDEVAAEREIIERLREQRAALQNER